MGNIYCITNIVDGKKYVGQTKYPLNVRFNDHIRHSKKNLSHCPSKLYNSINKYGEENFKIELLELVADEQLYEKERYWIDKLNTVENGLNISYGGKGSPMVSKKEIEIIIDKYKSGMTINEVSNYINYCQDTVSSVLKSNNIQIERNRYSKRTSKKIHMLDKNDKLLKTFGSIHDAERFLMKNRTSKCNSNWLGTHIKQVANGLRKSAYGFKWSF